MAPHLQTATTPRQLYMQTAQEQLDAFERSEAEFRKRVREERAAALHVRLEGRVFEL